MKSPIFRIIIAAAVCSMMGCAMCCGPYDYDYPNFGGKHERMDRTWGRVGSIFSDPMANPAGESADSNLKDPETRKSRSTDDAEDSQRLRDRLQQELEEKERLRRLDSEPETRPVPDSKEAMQHLQRPSRLSDWR